MSAADALAMLVRATGVITLALVAVALLRAPARQLFGSVATSVLWLLVPASLLGMALPHAAIPASMEAMPLPPIRMWPVIAQAAAPTDHSLRWLGVWLAGAIAFAAWTLLRQRRFVASLGGIAPLGRVHVATFDVPGLPATLGFMRPRIVVPPDFHRAYPRRERALMLMHERAHLRAHDVHATAAAVLLRGLFWFHPLVHVAAAAFRRDLELACDARVAAAVPRIRRLYGETLLKVQVAADPLPIGCHWGPVHPLKERLSMLAKPMPSPTRRRAGVLVVALLGIVTATAASVRPASPRDANLEILARVDDGAPRQWRGPVAPGQPHHYNWPTDDGHAWSMDLSARPQPGGRHRLDAVIAHDGRVVARPVLVVVDGKPGGIGLGEQGPHGFRGLRLQITLAGR